MTKLLAFARDERGVGTIMSLLWFLILVAFIGVVVDTTNGFRNKTMLQATADASALAAVIDLPNENVVKATAVHYARTNMGFSLYGNVLEEENIHIGTWDHDTRTFTPESENPDAVWVRLGQTETGGNPVPVSFLRIIGLRTWDIQTQAIAQRFIPGCLRDGLVAREMVELSTQNSFHNYICVHGQEGVHMRNHNSFEPGVVVSMPDLEMLEIPSSDKNPGLDEALRENILDPRMVDHTDEIMSDVVSLDTNVLPDYINSNEPVLLVDEKFDFSNTEPGRVYEVRCQPNKQIKIPQGAELENVVIVSDCNIHVGNNVKFSNVFLGSRAAGNGPNGVDQSNINFASNVQLGRPDDCSEGGGVQLVSNASMHFSSTMTINGVQMVAAGNIMLAARQDGINGISAQAGGDIKLTSRGSWGLCAGDAPNLFTVDYYRLVL